MQKIFSTWHFKTTCIIIAIIAATVFFALQKKEYSVQADGREKVVKAYRWQTIPAIIRSAGFTLGEGDAFVLPKDNVIELVHAVNIVVFADGGRQVVPTGQMTVEKALQKAGISVKGREIFPSGGAKPTEGMTVVLLRENEKILENVQEIPYKIAEKYDSRLQLGEREVLKEGVNGKKKILTKITVLADGKMQKEVLAETIMEIPQDQLVTVGASDLVQTARGQMRFVKTLVMEATAYTPWDEGCIGITKTGIPARYGVVAVDPEVIKLGSRLYIPGYGQAIAADIGGAIVGNRIDLCMESVEQAIKFGRRPVKVYILE
ncbi:MAG: G5 domain-containing protein [Acidaminococcales bacterium]|nr:G5 domain-containing protein [Acidaminococcales bacterium]